MSELKTYQYVDPDEGLNDMDADRIEVQRRYREKNKEEIRRKDRERFAKKRRLANESSQIHTTE